MAQNIKIKRSTVTSAPTSLAQGELAYSQVSKKLFIGQPGGTLGDIVAIGGQYYTEVLDGITEGSGITLLGDVTGTSIYDTNTYSWSISTTLSDTTVTPGSYGSATSIPTFTVDQQGRITAASTENIATNLDIEADTGADSISLLAETLTFQGGTGVGTAVNPSTNTVEFSIGQSVGTTDNVTFNNVTVNGALTSDDITSTNISVDGNAIISGNLIVNGTTTTVNSTTVTIDDIILTLGGDTEPSSNDSLDRGIEFRWHDGASPKLGFFGFDHSTGEFTYIPDSTNTANIVSGARGAAYFGSLKLDTPLDVLYGGTGRATFTQNGILYGNANSALEVTVAGTWDPSHSVGQLLSVNASGVPTWTNDIDGGSF